MIVVVGMWVYTPDNYYVAPRGIHDKHMLPQTSYKLYITTIQTSRLVHSRCVQLHGFSKPVV
jgi:hypothetical protein